MLKSHFVKMEYETPIPINSDLEKRVADAFALFDHIGNKTIDVREVGTILRFLGCAPTEQEINEIISATEFEDSRGNIHLSRFLPHVCQQLNERKMEPVTPEKLLEAFQVLDPEGLGYLTKDYMAKVMMEEGEPFTQEELDEMIAIAVDPQSGNVSYENYINQLMVGRVYLYLIAGFAQHSSLPLNAYLSRSPKQSTALESLFNIPIIYCTIYRSLDITNLVLSQKY